MFYQIDRSALILTPTQAFFEMLARIDGEETIEALEMDVHDSSTVYLISEDFNDTEEVFQF